MDKRTMREFDELRLRPMRPPKPKEIRAADAAVGRGHCG
jgi:hypothetical protein